MYIKIYEDKLKLQAFNKSYMCIVFSFENEISKEIFENASSIELYSDDNIFLRRYNLSDYYTEINANELCLKIPTTKDIDIYKQEKIEISKQLLANWLQNNPLLYKDGKYYSVTSEKQSLLNGNLASYERALNAGVEYPLKWNSTGEECTEWSYSDLVELSLSIAEYVAPKVTMQQAYELQIKACESVDEINEIVISYD